MTPRDYIGNTFVVKAAIELRLDDEVLVHDIATGLFVTTPVMSLELIGDDVEVNQDTPHHKGFGTSMGNAVMVQVK